MLFLQYWITGGIFGLGLATFFVCCSGLSDDPEKKLFRFDFRDTNCIFRGE